MSEQSKIVKKEETKPCGCHFVEYADETRELSPCAPCGLMGSAKALQAAAEAMFTASQALSATAARLHQDRGRAALDRAARHVVGG